MAKVVKLDKAGNKFVPADLISPESFAGMTTEKLSSLEEKLHADLREIEDKYVSHNVLIDKDTDKVIGIFKDVSTEIIPQLEFDVALATTVAMFNEKVNQIVNDKVVTMSPNDFNNLVRGISKTTFKGPRAAIVLDQLSSLLNNVAFERKQLDEAYQQVATVVDACSQEIERRKTEAHKAEEHKAESATVTE